MRTNDEIWEEIRSMQQWMNVYSHAIDVMSDDFKKMENNISEINKMFEREFKRMRVNLT